MKEIQLGGGIEKNKSKKTTWSANEPLMIHTALTDKSTDTPEGQKDKKKRSKSVFEAVDWTLYKWSGITRLGK